MAMGPDAIETDRPAKWAHAPPSPDRSTRMVERIEALDARRVEVHMPTTRVVQGYTIPIADRPCHTGDDLVDSIVNSPQGLSLKTREEIAERLLIMRSQPRRSRSRYTRQPQGRSSTPPLTLSRPNTPPSMLSRPNTPPLVLSRPCTPPTLLSPTGGQADVDKVAAGERARHSFVGQAVCKLPTAVCKKAARVTRFIAAVRARQFAAKLVQSVHAARARAIVARRLATERLQRTRTSEAKAAARRAAPRSDSFTLAVMSPRLDAHEPSGRLHMQGTPAFATCRPRSRRRTTAPHVVKALSALEASLRDGGA